MSDPRFIIGFVLFVIGAGLIGASGGIPNGGLVFGIPVAFAGVLLMGRTRV